MKSFTLIINRMASGKNVEAYDLTLTIKMSMVWYSLEKLSFFITESLPQHIEINFNSETVFNFKGLPVSWTDYVLVLNILCGIFEERKTSLYFGILPISNWIGWAYTLHIVAEKIIYLICYQKHQRLTCNEYSKLNLAH